jgi:protein tyrosine/serine phosphatase
MSRINRIFLGSLIAILLTVGPVAYWQYRQPFHRNLRVVQDGVLYRSGQLSLAGLDWAIRDYGIKTVITLRDSSSPKETAPDSDEYEFCLGRGVAYYRIAPRSWSPEDGSIPADEGVSKFLKILDNPANHPVLIHCFGGVHRTGAFTAIYRMEYDQWSNQQAIAELRANGYTTLEDDWNLLDFLEDYRPRWVKRIIAPDERAIMHPTGLKKR